MEPDQVHLVRRRSGSVGPGHRPRPLPRAPLRHRSVRGHPGLRHRRRAGGLPPRRPHAASGRLGQGVSDSAAPGPPRTCATAALDLVRANELPACYLRPIVFYGTGSIGLNPAGAVGHSRHHRFRAWGAYLGEEGVDKGIRVRVSSWRRVGHEAMIPNAKGTGQYLNSVLAKQEAIAGGYDEALLLNTAGYVVEGSGENLFLVRDGVVRTPPTTAWAPLTGSPATR